MSILRRVSASRLSLILALVASPLMAEIERQTDPIPQTPRLRALDLSAFASAIDSLSPVGP